MKVHQNTQINGYVSNSVVERENVLDISFLKEK